MKTKLQILLAAFFIALGMAKASAQGAINPQTGLPEPAPVNPQTGLPEPPPFMIDAATGLPADGSPPFRDTNGAPTWISPSWKDPGKVLEGVDFQNLPISEVARQLRERFLQALRLDYFDIIFPNAPAFDPTQISVDLQLKNVTASEIFSAMNLQFELNKSPLRWELTLNGSRPTAILRNLPQLVPPPPPPPAPPSQIRKVFFVGDIIDDYPGTNDVFKLADLSDMVRTAWGNAGLRVGKVNSYPKGQLLIVSGTQDQVDLADQTLRALKDKAEYDKAHPPPVKSQ